MLLIITVFFCVLKEKIVVFTFHDFKPESWGTPLIQALGKGSNHPKQVAVHNKPGWGFTKLGLNKQTNKKKTKTKTKTKQKNEIL